MYFDVEVSPVYIAVTQSWSNFKHFFPSQENTNIKYCGIIKIRAYSLIHDFMVSIGVAKQYLYILSLQHPLSTLFFCHSYSFDAGQHKFQTVKMYALCKDIHVTFIFWYKNKIASHWTITWPTFDINSLKMTWFRSFSVCFISCRRLSLQYCKSFTFALNTMYLVIPIQITTSLLEA